MSLVIVIITKYLIYVIYTLKIVIYTNYDVIIQPYAPPGVCVGQIFNTWN